MPPSACAPAAASPAGSSLRPPALCCPRAPFPPPSCGSPARRRSPTAAPPPPPKGPLIHMLDIVPTPLAPAGTAAVAATAVTRRYGDGESAVDALRGVTLEVPAAQFTAVMGPSGSGKSTLMHLLAGLDSPTSGTVAIGGQDITRMGDKQLTTLRRRHIGFVFQQFNLLPMLTAEENILLPLSVAGRKPQRGDLQALMTRVGLEERRGHRPSELSGGQQQRVAIARALISQPTVLFAD